MYVLGVLPVGETEFGDGRATQCGFPHSRSLPLAILWHYSCINYVCCMRFVLIVYGCLGHFLGWGGTVGPVFGFGPRALRRLAAPLKCQQSLSFIYIYIDCDHVTRLPDLRT